MRIDKRKLGTDGLHITAIVVAHNGQWAIVYNTYIGADLLLLNFWREIMKVEIQFKKGPTLTYNNVSGRDVEDAKQKALASARNEGFREAVKKITVIGA